MAKRKSTGKRLRFEVLKRDGFRCRYCGTTSMETMLHVDHVVPVVDGGTDDPTNLAAACAACNGGKSSVPLNASQLHSPRPDSLREHAKQVREMLEAAKDLHLAKEEYARFIFAEVEGAIGLIPDSCIDALRAVSARHSSDEIFHAARVTSSRLGGRGGMNGYRYFFGVLRNIRSERNGT